MGVVVDLIFATAGIEAEIVADAEVLEILPEVSMPVATVGHLVAVELIIQRGYARGRSLSAMLDAYLDNAGTA